MYEFLVHLDLPQARELDRDLARIWDERAQRLNERLRREDLPVQVANMSSIWTVCYTQPSRYNWMLQYYLHAQGLALSWIGTGRLIFSLNYTAEEFDEVAERFVAAARTMQNDGWWWRNPALTNKAINRRILREMIVHGLFSTRSRPTAPVRLAVPQLTRGSSSASSSLHSTRMPGSISSPCSR
jgi:glutamate-1-semialdehyde 2,1-aminomutase